MSDSQQQNHPLIALREARSRQPIEAKPKIVRLNSAKSAARIAPAIREQLADAVMVNPCHISITKHFSSHVLQVIFSVLYVVLHRQRKIEQRLNARDGYGRPSVMPPADRRDWRGMGEAA